MKNILDINSPLLVDKSSCVENRTVLLSQTLLTPEVEHNREGISLHKNLVCVLCYFCTPGREYIHCKNHKNVVSQIHHFEAHFNDILWAQCTLTDLELADLLLFPTAWRENTGGFYGVSPTIYCQNQSIGKAMSYAISSP